MSEKRVATTVRIEARGFGVLKEYTEDLRPGDTFTVTVDIPFVIESDGKVVGLIHKGQNYRVVPA